MPNCAALLDALLACHSESQCCLYFHHGLRQLYVWVMEFILDLRLLPCVCVVRRVQQCQFVAVTLCHTVVRLCQPCRVCVLGAVFCLQAVTRYEQPSAIFLCLLDRLQSGLSLIFPVHRLELLYSKCLVVYCPSAADYLL